MPDTEREAELRRFDVDAEAAASADRLDRFLGDRLELSRTRVAALIAEGEVEVNGAPVKKSYEPAPGDRITIRIPPPEPLEVTAQPLDVEIVHQDEDLAVVDKPAGMVVHPAPGHEDGTLVNALLHHLDRLSNVGAPRRPGIVHRLDMDTSGLLVVAKSDAAHHALSEALSRREFDRGYLAASWGHLDADRLAIDRPVGRDPGDRTRMAVVEDGKAARTHVLRLERWRSADLLALKLDTGRTHQIRVHLRDIGHPVVCDPTYAEDWEKGFVGAGGRWAEEFAGRCGRLFLHAAKLAFEHPRTGERMKFVSDLPEPLSGALEWARATS